jgi:hypothetical protein
MRKWILRLILLLLIIPLLAARSEAATKVHVIAFGKWMSVQWLPDSTDKPVPFKVRALLVDGQVKEYAVGARRTK